MSGKGGAYLCSTDCTCGRHKVERCPSGCDCYKHRPKERRGKALEKDKFFDLAILQAINDCIEWPFSRDRGYGIYNRFGLRGAHVISLTLASGPKPAGKYIEALHSCDNPPCINPAHLRWGTKGDNARDRASRGRNVDNTGSRHGLAKLDEDTVSIMRQHRDVTGEPYAKMAVRFGVSTMTVHRAVKGESWDHV